MKKLLYVFYFAVIANHFMPVADVWGMATDVLKPSYEVTSISDKCFNPNSFSASSTDHLETVFKAYGSAARGGLCSS